jgi:hypothetical protein
MDVRDLATFEDGTFDIAIDKGKGAFVGQRQWYRIMAYDM